MVVVGLRSDFMCTSPILENIYLYKIGDLRTGSGIATDTRTKIVTATGFLATFHYRRRCKNLHCKHRRSYCIVDESWRSFFVSDRNGVATHQSMSYLNSVCKSYSGLLVVLMIDDPKSTWGSLMSRWWTFSKCQGLYVLCEILWCWFWARCWFQHGVSLS